MGGCTIFVAHFRSFDGKFFSIKSYLSVIRFLLLNQLLRSGTHHPLPALSPVNTTDSEADLLGNLLFQTAQSKYRYGTDRPCGRECYRSLPVWECVGVDVGALPYRFNSSQLVKMEFQAEKSTTGTWHQYLGVKMLFVQYCKISPSFLNLKALV